MSDQRVENAEDSIHSLVERPGDASGGDDNVDKRPTTNGETDNAESSSSTSDAAKLDKGWQLNHDEIQTPSLPSSPKDEQEAQNGNDSDVAEVTLKDVEPEIEEQSAIAKQVSSDGVLPVATEDSTQPSAAETSTESVQEGNAMATTATATATEAAQNETLLSETKEASVASAANSEEAQSESTNPEHRIDGTEPQAEASTIPQTPAPLEALKETNDVVVVDDDGEVPLPKDSPEAVQVAILLKINKELLRLCLDLQQKDMTSDQLFKECASRLQANLGALARMASGTDAQTPAGAEKSPSLASQSSTTRPQPLAQLQVQPFPITPLTQNTLLPKLYAHLRSVTGVDESITSDVPAKELPKSPFAVPQSPAAMGNKKRAREDATETSDTNAAATPVAAAAATGLPVERETKAQKTTAVNRATATKPAAPRRKSSSTAMSPAVSHAHAPSPSMSAASNVRPPPLQANATPSAQQLQGLVQAFGQNAIGNLNALQSHYKNQIPNPLIAFMEANVPNFRFMPLQMQLQQMGTFQQQQQMASASTTTGMSLGMSPTLGTQQLQQIAASPSVQHQRQASVASTGMASPPIHRPGSAAARRASSIVANATSPVATPPSAFNAGGMRNASMHSATQSPMAAPMQVNHSNSTASPQRVMTPNAVRPQQQQQQQPQQQFPMFQAQQQGMQNGFGGGANNFATNAGNANLNANTFANLPPQLQQQLLQQFLSQQQQQPQQNLYAARPTNGNASMMSGMFPTQNLPQATAPGMPNLANMWAAMQQQQSQQPRPS